MDAVGSCILQRWVLNRSIGPWFSHVAVVITDRLVIEATTAPDEGRSTWSGAILTQGVRLQLIPDLLDAAQSYAVLRHHLSPDIAAQFNTQTPDVALLLGGGYSTQALVRDARRGHAFLSSIIPSGWFDWAAQPDEIERTLRDDTELRAGIERHLRTGEALASLNDYFCSQLAAILLARVGLTNEPTELVTPCALFDSLVTDGWRDVTGDAYGAAAIDGWKSRRDRGEDWKLTFRKDAAVANFARELALARAMTSLITERLDAFGAKLDATRRRLEDRR